MYTLWFEPRPWDSFETPSGFAEKSVVIDEFLDEEKPVDPQ